MPARRPSIDRQIQRRLRATHRSIGIDVERLRTDAGATMAHLAGIAGIDRSFEGRVEAGVANPSLETLTALAIALGADLSIRFYPGSGFEATLRVAYPAPTRSAVKALVAGEPWPGDSIIWVRIEGDLVELLEGPPRGVPVGR